MQGWGAISGERGTGEGEEMRPVACHINKVLIYSLPETYTSAANAQRPSVQVQQMEVASETKGVRGLRPDFRFKTTQPDLYCPATRRFMRVPA
jgi:hypothetical protein